MKTINFITLCAITWQSSIFALGTSIGTYVPYFSKAQTSEDGGRKTVAANPFVSIDHNFHLFGNHFFSPEIGFAKHLEAEEGVSKTTLFLVYDMEYAFSAKWMLRYGFANFMTKIGGDGESRELANGSGTATFYAPSENTTSYTSSMNLGTRFVFMPNLNARFDLHLMRFLSSERRTLAYLLSVGYLF